MTHSRFRIGPFVHLLSSCLVLTACEPAQDPAPTPMGAPEVLALTDPLERSHRFAALLRESGPEDLASLRDALDHSTVYGGDPEVTLLALWWAGFDPEAALRFARADWRAGHAVVIAAVFRKWATIDPEAAFESVDEVKAPVQHDMAVDAVVLGWAESGKPGLVEKIRALPGGAERQRPAEVLARIKVATLGPDGAKAWLDALPEDDFTFVMRNRIASATAELDPQAAIAWAEERIRAAKRPTGLPRRIGTRWARRDGRAALEWLSTLPAGKDRDDGVSETFRDWFRIAHADAKAWVDEQVAKEPLEAWTEPALAVFARLRSRVAPEEALALIARFSDEDLRDATTTVVARGWLERDTWPADAWLQEADIPHDVRRRAYMISSKKRRELRDAGTPLRLPDPPLPKGEGGEADS